MTQSKYPPEMIRMVGSKMGLCSDTTPLDAVDATIQVSMDRVKDAVRQIGPVQWFRPRKEEIL